MYLNQFLSIVGKKSTIDKRAGLVLVNIILKKVLHSHCPQLRLPLHWVQALSDLYRHALPQGLCGCEGHIINKLPPGPAAIETTQVALCFVVYLPGALFTTTRDLTFTDTAHPLVRMYRHIPTRRGRA